MNVVISAFPGCGKSTLFNKPPAGFSVFDSDSFMFNKEMFPVNYIEHIKALIRGTGNKIILVSSHKEVRDLMDKEDIDYTLVVPSRDIKDEYIQRYIDRGNTSGFVDLLRENWDTFLDSCTHHTTIELKSGEFLSSVLWFK